MYEHVMACRSMLGRTQLANPPGALVEDLHENLRRRGSQTTRRRESRSRAGRAGVVPSAFGSLAMRSRISSLGW